MFVCCFLLNFECESRVWCFDGSSTFVPFEVPIDPSEKRMCRTERGQKSASSNFFTLCLFFDAHRPWAIPQTRLPALPWLGAARLARPLPSTSSWHLVSLMHNACLFSKWSRRTWIASQGCLKSTNKGEHILAHTSPCSRAAMHGLPSH